MINIWKSNANGFVPGAANLSINKSRDPVLKIPVGEAELAYIRAAAVDNWGESGLNISGQFPVTGKSVDTAAIQAELDALQIELAYLENDLIDARDEIESLNGMFPVTETNIQDDSISTPKLKTNSVTADKVLALSIVTEKLAALAVTIDKMAANSVSTRSNWLPCRLLGRKSKRLRSLRRILRLIQSLRIN